MSIAKGIVHVGFLFLICALSFVPTASAQTADEIKGRGVIKVGVVVDLPPFGLMNAQNEPDGFEIDVAKSIAKSLGVKIEFVPVNGQTRIPYLQSQRVDMLVSALGITPERAQQVLFSEPYSVNEIILYGKKDAKISDAAGMKEYKIGVPRSSTQETAIVKTAPEGTQIQRFDDQASTVQALLSGQVDAIGVPGIMSPEIDKVAPAGAFTTKFVLFSQFQAAAVRLGQDNFLKAVNEAIEKSKNSGELGSNYKKWIGKDLPDAIKSGKAPS